MTVKNFGTYSDSSEVSGYKKEIFVKFRIFVSLVCRADCDASLAYLTNNIDDRKD